MNGMHKATMQIFDRSEKLGRTELRLHRATISQLSIFLEGPNNSDVLGCEPGTMWAAYPTIEEYQASWLLKIKNPPWGEVFALQSQRTRCMFLWPFFFMKSVQQ